MFASKGFIIKSTLIVLEDFTGCLGTTT